MAYLGNTIVNGVLKAINGISGNGSGITDINASNISTGTLNAERLPESYLPLAGGTLNGGLTWLGGSSGTALCGFKFGTGAAAANYYQPNFTSMDFGWNWDTGAGSGMAFRGTSYGGSQAGAFIFFARNSTSNYKQLEGYVDGTLKWTGSLFTVGGGTGTITGNITGNVLTGYTKPTTTSAIAATDTLNGAIGKLEKALDSKQTSINSSRSIEFITGTQTAATGAFRGVTEDTSLYDGKCINYYLPYAGSGNATLELTFPDGSTSGAKSIFIVNSTRLTTHYSAGTIFQMTYSATKDAWYCGNYWYDTNTQNVVDNALYGGNAYPFSDTRTNSILYGGTSSGYVKLAANKVIDITYPIILPYSTNNFYTGYGTSLRTLTGNSSITTAAGRCIYLVGTLSGTQFTIDNTVATDTTPSSDNGKTYLWIGIAYDTVNFYFLTPSMRLFHYKNGAFRPYDPTTAETGSSNGTIKINGTDVAVKGLGTAAYTASTAYAASGHNHDSVYLKLSGGTMTGSIQYSGATREILSFAPTDNTWRGGLKYSWSSNTTVALWSKNSKAQFVWHAGTDFSTVDVNGTATRTYDFQVGRVNGTGALQALVGGTAVSLEGHTHNYAGSSSAGGAATTALKVQNNPAAGSTADLVYSQMGSNDYFRIQTGGAANAGYVELATADDGTEPIYVRQYTGVFGSLTRTATLLDGSGNTIFPGSVTVGSHGTIAYNSATGCIELSVA